MPMDDVGVRPDPAEASRSWFRDHLPELAWGLFAVMNVIEMLWLTTWQTVPFHFIWLSLSILYGFRMWRVRSTVIVLVVVMAVAGFALIRPVFAFHEGWSALDESTEVPLMAAIFVTMVWHARRRQTAMRETERALGRERDAVTRLRAADDA